LQLIKHCGGHTGHVAVEVAGGQPLVQLVTQQVVQLGQRLLSPLHGVGVGCDEHVEHVDPAFLSAAGWLTAWGAATVAVVPLMREAWGFLLEAAADFWVFA
jgi:hypothetical protein